MQLHPDFVAMVMQLRDRHGFELNQLREAERLAETLRWNPDASIPRDELHGLYSRAAASLLGFSSTILEHAKKVVRSIHYSILSGDAIRASDRGLSRPHTGSLSYAYENMGRVLHAVIALVEVASDLETDVSLADTSDARGTSPRHGSMKIQKKDDALWLRHLREVGIEIPEGTRCTITVNGTPVDFVPMSAGRDGRRTQGLKAAGTNATWWHSIPKNSWLDIHVSAHDASASTQIDSLPPRTIEQQTTASGGTVAPGRIDANSEYSSPVSGRLSQGDIVRLHRALLDLALDREVLLAGVNADFVAALPLRSTHSAQILSDLYVLNATAQLADFSYPLLHVLVNAAALSRARPEAEQIHTCIRLLGTGKEGHR